jgi:hypothetical protein
MKSTQAGIDEPRFEPVSYGWVLLFSDGTHLQSIDAARFATPGNAYHAMSHEAMHQRMQLRLAKSSRKVRFGAVTVISQYGPLYYEP